MMTFLICTTLFLYTLIVYHHLGYPWLLKVFGRQLEKNNVPVKHRCYQFKINDMDRPSVTIVVPAYNESAWIAQKINNLASLDYPKGKLKVIIACDGCTDETASIARDTIQSAICEDTHFEVIEFEKNRGKVAVLNQIITTSSSELVALSDVSSLISVDALLLASDHFENPSVGVVSSRYCYLDQDTSESCYWQYQTKIKTYESNIGSTLGAHGAFYMFRRTLFNLVPSNIINDDFYLPMDIVRQGYKTVHEPKIHAVELETSNRTNDFCRRVRISAGNMQQVWHLKNLFLPKYGAVAFLFASGKGLRVLMPYIMLGSLVTTIMLTDYTIFTLALGGQIALYAIAIFNHLFPWLFSHKICRAIRYLVVGHTANLIGGLRYMLGLESGHWKKVSQ